MRPKQLGGIRGFFAVFTVIALGVLAFAAYKFFTNRAGEAAIQDIPADAAMILTFDGTPSATQALAFEKINQALKDEGVPDEIAKLMDQGFNKDAFAKDIKPYVTDNAAMAMWNMEKSTSDPDIAVYISVSDPGKVAEALKKNLQPGSQDGQFKLPKENGVVGVVGNYCVMTSKEPRFAQIVKVSKGELPSVSTLSAYKKARSILPSDSNFMAFVTPEVYKAAHQKAFSDDWGSLGAAIRSDGLAIACRFPEGNMNLSTLPAFDTSSLKNLPAGAYGVIGTTDISDWVDHVKKQVGDTASFDKGVADMEKQTGLNFVNDVMPGIKGNFEFAAYPGKGSSKMPELLGYWDSANGANPAALAQKIHDSMLAHADNWGHVTISESKKGDATVWRLTNPKPANNLNTSAVAVPPAAGAPGAPDQVPDNANAMQVHGPNVGNVPTPAPNDGTPDHADLILLKDKVYITTADDLTDKVTSMSTDSLATDGPFVSMTKTLGANSQSILMVSVSRILQTVSNGPDAAEVNAIFGDPKTGVTGSCKFDATTGTADLFIPLDWGKAIHWIGKNMKQMDSAQQHQPKMGGMSS